MRYLFWLGLAAYALVVAGWWLRHLLLSLPRPLGLVVAPGGAAADLPRVSVVVPARDERDRIGPCLESLLAQGPLVGQVIVVDDRSRDGTGAYVRRLVAGDPRVRVERVNRLASGWSGKAHACQVGAAAASGAWILFTDADCRLLRGGLAGAVRYAERRQLDLLSLWGRADHRSFWERVLMPLCGALILYWFPPLRLGRWRRGPALANGQFILIRREAYRRIGGHAAARQAVIEDVPLAQQAERSGLRVRMALGPGILAVRMYRSFAEIRDGWTRIFVGALQRRWKLLASVWSLLGGSLLPSLGAPLAAAGVLLRGWPAEALLDALFVLLWLHFLALYSVSYRLWGLCRCARWPLLLYPLSCLVVGALLLRGWWWMVARRPVVWRGSISGVAGGAPAAAGNGGAGDRTRPVGNRAAGGGYNAVGAGLSDRAWRKGPI